MSSKCKRTCELVVVEYCIDTAMPSLGDMY